VNQPISQPITSTDHAKGDQRMPDDLSDHAPTESIETGSRRNTLCIRTAVDRQRPALLDRLNRKRQIIALGYAR
jgi:hypothetical protein